MFLFKVKIEHQKDTYAHVPFKDKIRMTIHLISAEKRKMQIDNTAVSTYTARTYELILKRIFEFFIFDLSD